MKSVNAVTRIAPRKLRASPARAICGMVTQPLPNTMALGGVATGIMNANEADMVAGTMSRRG